MKKIVSLALLMTLCSAPLMQGMQQQPPISANSRPLTGPNTEEPLESSSSSSRLPQPAETQSQSNWGKHLKTGLWGAAGAGLGLIAGVLGYRANNLRKEANACALEAKSYSSQISRDAKFWSNASKTELRSSIVSDVFGSLCGVGSLFCLYKARQNHRSK